MSAPVDVIAQAIRAKEGTGRAASVFAEEILADLDAAGYVIRKKPATRSSAPRPRVEPFAPNTGNPAVDEFMRKHHDPKYKPAPLPKSPGLPALRPMKGQQAGRRREGLAHRGRGRATHGRRG